MRIKEWWERAGFSASEAERVRTFLTWRESNWSGAHGHTSSDRDIVLNRKRFAASQRRAFLKSLSSPRPRNLPVQVLLASQKDSKLLESFKPDRTAAWQPVLNRTPRSDLIIQNFSMIDHPHETLETLTRIAQFECDCAQAYLHFEDDDCLDIGAFLVLEAMWRDMAPFFAGGRIDASIASVIEAIGLRKALRWKPLPRDKDVYPFLFRRQERPPESSRSEGIEPTRAAKVATELGVYLNRALKVIAGVELTREARSHIKRLASEILDNAETHGTADKRGSYTIAGYITRRPFRTGWKYRFHLGLLSLGQTIASGLVHPPVRLRQGMATYINRHRSPRFTDENLRTVYALRDGVTRLTEKLDVHEGHPVGGTGLADILEFFAGLSVLSEPEDEPKLVIISGRTYMRVVRKHLNVLHRPIGPHMGEVRQDREFWFNDANSASQPPDEDCVYSLPKGLPGTLVTMAFDLNPRLMETLEG